MSQTRNTGIDLLRLVLMFFIIMGHLFTHTPIREILPVLSAKGLWCWGTQSICLCAVNCFVLITGYFMIRARWKLEHLLKLWLTILLYGLGIGALFVLIGKAPLSPALILNMCFPILRRVWWFMSAYVLLYLFIPFLNAGLQRLTPRQFAFLAAGITVIFYILPIFGFFFPPYDPLTGMSITGFVTLYILGAYLATQKITLSPKWCIAGLVVSNLCILGSKILLDFIVDKYHLGTGTGLLYHYNTAFELCNGVLLLLLFAQFKFTRASKFIVGAASGVFAVYLLHEHPLMRKMLWQSGLLSFLQQSSALEFAAISVVIPVIILAVGIGIDKIVRLLLLNNIFRSHLWGKIIALCHRFDLFLADKGDLCQTR